MGEPRFILHLLYDVNIGIESAEHCLFRPSNNFLQNLITKEFECFAKTFQVFVGCVFPCNLLGYVTQTFATSRFVFLRSARLCCLDRMH